MVMIVPDFAEKLLFFDLRVSCMVFVPPLWLLFVSAVFGRWQWMQRGAVPALLLAPSLVNFALLLWPATRPLFFYELAPFSFENISLLSFKLGPLYKVFFVWSMLLMALSYVLSGMVLWKERGFRRRQVLVLNAGLGVALLQALFPMWLPNTEEIRWLVSSTISLACTQIGILYAVVQQRLLNLVPLAAARIFQRFPDPVLVIDDHDQVMGASDRAIEFFGLPRDFLGRKVSGLLPGLRLQPGEQVLAGAMKKSQHFHLAVESLGEPNSSPGSVVFFRDIGAQKQVEQRLNEGLEFRARLLAFLAHDLTGFLENQALLSVALQTELGEEYPQAEMLAHSAQSSQELVGNVMAWAKSQAVRFLPDARSFEWNTLIRETLDQMESRFKAKGVKAAFDSGANPLVGRGDSEMLAAVFRNFVSNALRANSRGKCVHVVLRSEAGRVWVSVRDEGEGIGPAELSLLLEITQDFSLGGVPGAQGSGLGLMLARHFIAAHSGEFRMESKLGAGTEVSFSVPL